MSGDLFDRLLLLAGSLFFVLSAWAHNWTACVILAGFWLWQIAWTLLDIKEQQKKPALTSTVHVNVPADFSADEFLRAIRNQRGGA